MCHEPEVFWCPVCGKNVWAIPEHVHDPAQLICNDCRKKNAEENHEEI